eukprot:2707201-Amphidinium_carterae.1
MSITQISSPSLLDAVTEPGDPEFGLPGLAISRTDRLISNRYGYPIAGCALPVDELPVKIVSALDGGGDVLGIENEMGALSLLNYSRDAVHVVNGRLTIVRGHNMTVETIGSFWLQSWQILC